MVFMVNNTWMSFQLQINEYENGETIIDSSFPWLIPKQCSYHDPRGISSSEYS
jgi:hypothetical protein